MSLSIPTVTGWSSFYGESVDAYQMLFARNSMERRLSMRYAPQSARVMRAVARALNGAAPGDTATATYKRVKGQAAITDFGLTGGAVEIETVTQIDRATTAADETYINNLIFDNVPNEKPAIAAGYPTDASGNGGGGKLGY